MGHVQGLGDLAVDGPGLDAGVMPQLPGVLRGAAEPALVAEGLAVFQQRGLSDLVGQIIDVLALGLDAPLAGNPLELIRILHSVVAAVSGLIEGMADLAAVVRVGGAAASGKAQEVAGDNTVDIAAADASGGLGGDAAGTHRADAAADAFLTKLAVGGLVLDALLPRVCTYLLARFKQAFGCGFHLFDSDQLHNDFAESEEVFAFKRSFLLEISQFWGILQYFRGVLLHF